jgi:hypothetical protein
VQALDTAPSQAEHTYAVTAVDVAGNESSPSESVYLNFALLPVNPLHIVQTDSDKPLITWAHGAGDIGGYDIYLGDRESGLKLNTDLLLTPAFTDDGFNNDERLYTVVPLDSADVEGPARSLLLPQVTATVAADAQVKRGVMNQLNYTVSNVSNEAINGITLRSRVGAHEHVSEPFNLNATESKTVPVIVGGFADLLDQESLRTTLDIVPNGGERIQLIRNSQINVVDAGLVLGLATREFTRGGTGEVQFSLENSSDVEIELITARNTGQLASNEIRFKLVDADNNVLSVTDYLRFTAIADNPIVFITLPNKVTVARIPAGETLVSDWIALPVPTTAPDELTVQMDIDKLHYRIGSPEQVDIGGLSTRRSTTITDTSYSADVTTITPVVSFGDQDVVITGTARDRLTNAPVALVSVKLVLSINGFERVTEVSTDADGTYRYTFTPLAGEAGIYKVSAVHPDILDRPESGQFTISRITVTPAKFSVRIPRHYDQTIPIKVTAAPGTNLTNLRIIYEAVDQPDGSLPAGISIDTGSPINIASGKTATINVIMRADETADATGRLMLAVLSDESGNDRLALLDASYEFSEAVPALFYSPSYVETGVAQGSSVTENVTLENRGLAALENVRVALLTPFGSVPPGWMNLSTPAQLGNIGVGDTRDIELLVNPGTNVLDNIYEFILRVTSDNAPTRDINVFASVTQSGIGNVLFKLADIYTATLDESGALIEGLAGARIRVQNESVYSVEETLFTDSSGEALFNDLPAGNYQFRAGANNHQDKVGRFKIKPGITTSQSVFLDYELVTVSWSVTEITIEDKYEITLSATFETNVPAPVVIADPLSTKLPDMQPGEVFYGEITLTNHGLIRADELAFSMPASDQYFKYEAMRGIPTSIEAKQRISIPYRVVMLTSLDPDGAASGGGCTSYITRAIYRYTYACANGDTSGGSGSTHWYSPGSGSCGGGGGIGGTYGGGGIGGGGGVGGGGYVAPVSGMPSCRPTCPDGNCPAGNNAGG